MATDGVWDNLFEDDIQVCVNSQLKNDNLALGNLKSASDCISTLAEAKSYDPTYVSPFTVEGRVKKEKKDHIGGKDDDITVILSQIKVNEI